MTKKELKFFLTVTKVISVNDLYKAGLKYVGGKPKPYIYKNPKADRMALEITEQLRAIDFSDYLDWLRNTKQFTITISFVLKSNITRKDVQNLDKSVIDIITKFIKEDLGISKFDDSLFTSVHFYKSIIPKASKEYCCVQIVESKDKLIVDSSEAPKKFFLGGTVAGDNWRKDLIPKLEEKGLEYFDPVIEGEWGEEDRKREEEEKELCDTKLFLITPRMKGVYSIAEIINEAWKIMTSGNGFLYFGILGSKEDYEEHSWKSLIATMELVKEIGQGNSRIKTGIVETPEKLLSL